MSLKAHKPRHRKPRQPHHTTALRAGVAGGVLSTLAVTAASSSATAAEAPATSSDTTTMALPALESAMTAGAQQAADATQRAADRYQLDDAREQATEQALRKAEAAQRKAEAERRAEAAREAAEREAAARAARDTERTTLSTSSVTGNAATVVNFLKAQVGKSYVLGATGPNAYDCSGLTSAAFQTVGISLPRTSQEQSTAGTPVSLDALQPGDILYWGGAGSAYHVGVYVGDGKFIGAQNSSTGVVERDLDWDPPSGAVRVL